MNKKDMLKEISFKLNNGEVSYYLQRNNINDKSTINDVNGDIEQLCKDKKNWLDIIDAVYTEGNKKKYIVATTKNKDVFIVTDTVTRTTFDVMVKMNTTALTIENLHNKGKKTVIEFGSVTKSPTETKETGAKQVDILIKELQKFKSLPPKELYSYLESLVKKTGA